MIEVVGRGGEFDEVAAKLWAKCAEILQVKGGDYAHGGGRLENFERVAKIMSISPLQALWIYMFKHWCAIERYCKEGQVESEPIQGRIADCINYLTLLEYMIQKMPSTRFPDKEIVCERCGSKYNLHGAGCGCVGAP